MARVAVIGMSNFGFYLARHLSEMGSDVLAIDRDEAAVDRIKGYVAMAVVGDATDRRILEKLDLDRMDAVVLSLGSDLESSILAAMHLKEMGVKNIVAKALSEDHVKILDLIGVGRIVFPERDMGIRVATKLHGGDVLDQLSLGPGLSIIEMVPTEEMLGRTPDELRFRERYGCQILAIKSTDPNETTFIPDPRSPIRKSHILIVMGRDQDLAKMIQK